MDSLAAATNGLNNPLINTTPSLSNDVICSSLTGALDMVFNRL
jgi:hypothetical protein